MLTCCVVFALSMSVVPAAAADEACSGWSPGTAWRSAATIGPITLVTAGVEDGIATRFASDIEDLLAAMDGVLPLDAAVVCAFDETELADDGGLVPENQRLHGAVLTSDRVVVLDAGMTAQFRPAVAVGLTYLALWDLAGDQGRDGYPEPLRDAVSQWFAAGLTSRLALHRDMMRRQVAFTRPEDDSTTDRWTYGIQSETFVWNPEFQESPVGDLVAYAVDSRGTDVLHDLTADTWDGIDTEWRVQRRFELLGDQRNAVDWRWGLGILLAALAAAATLAYLQRVARRRHRYRPGDTTAAPGFFDE